MGWESGVATMLRYVPNPVSELNCFSPRLELMVLELERMSGEC